jgi:hypothetical protein
MHEIQNSEKKNSGPFSKSFLIQSHTFNSMSRVPIDDIGCANYTTFSQNENFIFLE